MDLSQVATLWALAFPNVAVDVFIYLFTVVFQFGNIKAEEMKKTGAGMKNIAIRLTSSSSTQESDQYLSENMTQKSKYVLIV